MPKIGAIIQARMGSQRLPGKVLQEVAGRPMLQYLIERMQHCPSLDPIVVATSQDPSDNPIASFCDELGVNCHRGPLRNVARRFREVLDSYPMDAFVRVNGDSPLLDQRLIAEGLGLFLEKGPDLVTNVMPRSFPKGQSVEVLSGDCYRSAFPLMKEEQDLEHVTRYFYRNRESFRIHNFESGREYGGIQLSVDTPEDMEIFSSLISRMGRRHWEYDLEGILDLYHSIMHPSRAGRIPGVTSR